jgi:glyoxylase-like metal-dependent hydrolase (beta-lactamase superfamily II)
MAYFNRRRFLQAMGMASAVAFLPSNSRGTSAQDAMRIGRVFHFEKGGLHFHNYVAPDASLAVTSHIVETPNQLVVIDTQFLQTFAREFKDYVDSLNKPVERVILSHPHPDHFLGANQFEDVPFVTTEAIAGGVQGFVESGGIGQVMQLVGESEMPAEPRLPEGSLTVGDLTVDGVSFSLENVTNAEAPDQLIVRVPDAGVVVLQDLLYNNMHFFPGVDRANWIATLEGLRSGLEGYDTLLVGHGLPTSKGELDSAVDYLTFVNDAAASAESADALIAALQARYPAYEGTFILSFWQQFFQPQ